MEATSLVELQAALLEAARASSARRAADTVYGGRDTLLRQTAMALLAGGELGEHASPPEATLQVLSGRVRLSGAGRSWEVAAGELLPIPPERHSLAALEDSVVLLSVLRAPAAGGAA
ncbi:MAG: LuxR family transcriptional regulator [Micrococcales bacterium 73-13]|nr:MAG: LuxR family transcriptional regulator [Micrococcales bacterium 73-13]